MAYYVYVLYSEKDGNLYTGFSNNLSQRIEQHNKGLVPSTKERCPLTLIYYEFSLSQNDATHREKYLKTTYGKRFLKSRLKHYLLNRNFTG